MVRRETIKTSQPQEACNDLKKREKQLTQI